MNLVRQIATIMPIITQARIRSIPIGGIMTHASTLLLLIGLRYHARSMSTAHVAVGNIIPHHMTFVKNGGAHFPQVATGITTNLIVTDVTGKFAHQKKFFPKKAILCLMHC